MDVIVTLVNPGASVGPFNIYSNVDSFATPIATSISRASLVAGYTLAGVSSSTTTVKLVSTGSCNSVIFLSVVSKTSTTTTTSTSTSTSTTSTSTSTTTSTTTISGPSYLFYFEFVGNSAETYQLKLNNVAGAPTTKTNYNLVQVGNDFYQLGGNTITKVGTGSSIISKIEKIDYDGTTVLQTIFVNGTSFIWSTYQTVMDSTGVGAGQYQTIRITIV